VHRQQLFFVTLLLALPMEAQSNQALPPNVPGVAGTLIPAHDNNSIRVPPQTTGPVERTLYRWSVAAVLAGASRTQPVVGEPRKQIRHCRDRKSVWSAVDCDQIGIGKELPCSFNI
jgi:hypothetical protein